ncbi:serine hydrolase domain-containing protein [Kitasatospora sp. NPDC048296]|uniref:serine hydrolase domain-containing protein n=1 Tax=Kitasatospora sp. NPDC048296 TaxID=3364048 RepID=UPI003721FAF5
MKKPLILTCATLLLATAPGTALAASADGAYPTQHPSRAVLSTAFSIRPGEPAVGGVGRVTLDGWSWRGADPDTVTGQRVAPGAEFHVGSISKTFLATVMLQLAAEHRVDLDGTVQQYLPGVLPDTFQPITIRELLNHTSGLPDVNAGAPPITVDQQSAGRLQYQTFDQIIQQTLRPTDRPWPGPVFAPGTAQQYNSFAYRVAGRIIEQVTGHSFAQEVTARIVRPLGLAHTWVPQGDPFLPDPHLPAYLTDSAGTLAEVTEQGGDPSSTVSTTGDLDRFLRALLDGELLPPAQQSELLTLPRDAAGRLLPSQDPNCASGPDKGLACFSAGLQKAMLADGTVLWGKTGHDLGYANGMFATQDLRERLEYSVAETDGRTGAPPAPAYRLAVAAFGPLAS